MPYQPSVISNITRNTTSVEGLSLNHSIFESTHSFFKERVRSYSSWTEVREDASIPSWSNAYAAARLAFLQNPAPSRFYLGRRLIDTTIVEADTAVVGTDYGFTIKVYNTTTGALDSTTAVSHTAATTAKADIATAWQLIVDALTGVGAAVATDTLVITPDSGYAIVTDTFVESTATFTTSEAAADLLQAIQDENNEWYCYMSEDHTEAFQLAMAAEIEATGSDDKPKIYWTSTLDSDTIVAEVDPAIDVIGKLKALGYDRTICDWHDQADTIFPEVGSFNYNSTYQPGGTTYKFMQVKGVPAIADPIEGYQLPTRFQGYIEDRNGGWMAEERGVNFYHGGKVVGGEWIDVILGVDWLNDRIEAAVLEYFLNQQGSKVSYAKPSSLKSVIDSELKRAVDVGFLDGYVGAQFPDYLTEIPFSDKVARILRDVKWTGYIAGAVHSIIINGNLTYQSAEIE